MLSNTSISVLVRALQNYYVPLATTTLNSTHDEYNRVLA
jgi:hypothetical protein